MATLKKHAQRTHLWRLQYKHPYFGWKQTTFKSQLEAEHAFKSWQYIESMLKSGQPVDHLLATMEKPKTIQDVFDEYINTKLKKKLNSKTRSRYMSTINNVLDVFGEKQIVKTLRETSFDGHVGWAYFQHIRETKGMKRRGITSDMKMAKVIFQWAYDDNRIYEMPIRKCDFYDDLETVKYKQWKKAEIVALFNHPELTEFEKDLIHVYTTLGVRASELLGFNKACPDKELHWEHVDFENSVIWISPKRTNERVQVYMDDSVKVVFEKWQEYSRPLDFTYSYLRKVIKGISEKTKITFTLHDLRRLKSQLIESQTGSIEKAAISIGDKSSSVVRNHYAGVSMKTQRDITKAFQESISNI